MHIKKNLIPWQILSLEGLAIYWNPATELYSKSDTQNIKTKLHTEIATKSSQPSFYKYGNYQFSSNHNKIFLKQKI